MPSELRQHFYLRPEITFLNHGSFGACPRPVMEAYQAWQVEAEREPVEFHGRRAPGLLRASREALGAFVGARAEDLVYVSNATYGVNVVARSLDFGPDDEVLGTDHEYGACERAWQFLALRGGAAYRVARLPYPIADATSLVDALFDQVGPRTRLLFVSHITSPTALTLPVAEICRRARERGVLTLIDGAHVPGQTDLDVESIGADFYVGNLHKWLCAPKGAAFLHARSGVQHLLQPLIVSWGWQPVVAGESPFIDHLQYTGTHDISAALAVPAAIEFQHDHDWKSVRQHCHDIVVASCAPISEALDAPSLAPDQTWYAQMCAFLLPTTIDGKSLQRRLFDDFGVEIPVSQWNDRETIRISIQGYNDDDDVERLVFALRSILGRNE